MSKCDIQLKLDNSARTYSGGDRVQGEVVLTAHETFDCKDLLFKLVWRTHGRGNRASTTVHEESLYSGQLIQGRTLNFRFDVALPNGPQTYHGHYVSVDWYVEAHAKIGWRQDVKAQEDVLVAANPHLPYVSGQPSALKHATSANPTGMLPPGCLALFFAPFLLIGLGAIIAGLLSSDIFSLIFGTFFGGLPLLGLGIIYRNKIARRKVGDVEFTLAPTEACPNDMVDVMVSFTPQTTLDLNGITATFRGHERVVSGSGTRRTTHTHTIHEQDIMLEPAGSYLRPGFPYKKSFQVRIPADAAPSFSASDNALKWSIFVRIDIPKWPDWVKEKDIHVIPSRPRAEAGPEEEPSPWES